MERDTYGRGVEVKERKREKCWLIGYTLFLNGEDISTKGRLTDRPLLQRERERERDTERETERDRDRERERETDRQTETERQRLRQRQTGRNRERERERESFRFDHLCYR